MLQTSLQSLLRSSKVHNHIHKPFVNNVFDWLLLVQGRTVRYTDIPKISVLNQNRYIDTGYSTIPIYRNFRYTGIFRYAMLNLPTIWRNHNLYFTTEWQYK
jgi:hypothetical protein